MESAGAKFQTAEFLEEVIRFYKAIEWMPNAHGVRFFSQNVWAKLPPSWAAALDEMSEEELYVLSIDLSVRKKTWPLSLQCFFKCVDRYQLSNIVLPLQSIFNDGFKSLYVSRVLPRSPPKLCSPAARRGLMTLLQEWLEQPA